jgi:hypothetical protein
MLQEKREFEVELIVTSRHLITTLSRTPEEAEQDAETLYEDGDTGQLLSFEVEQSDAYPVGEDVELDDSDEAELELLNGE